jgi:hypothetical protein
VPGDGGEEQAEGEGHHDEEETKERTQRKRVREMTEDKPLPSLAAASSVRDRHPASSDPGPKRYAGILMRHGRSLFLVQVFLLFSPHPSSTLTLSANWQSGVWSS